MPLVRDAISEGSLLLCARLSTMRRCSVFLDFFPITPSVVYPDATGNQNVFSGLAAPPVIGAGNVNDPLSDVTTCDRHLPRRYYGHRSADIRR